MEAGEKINFKLIDSLRENFKHAFLVLDVNGNILSCNTDAQKLFDLKSESENIFDILDENSAEQLNDLVRQTNIGQNGHPLVGNISLKSSKTLLLKITVNVFSEGTTSYIFCTFKKLDQQFNIEQAHQLKFKPIDLDKFIQNKNIVHLLDSLKTSFPFTHISKEKFRKLINELDVFFWIKDVNSKYIIVNEALAKSFGLNVVQIEGKEEKLFLPPYQVQLFAAIDNYIKNSNNCAISEGIPLHGLAASDRQQIVQFPLNDSEKNVTAIIGISQNNGEAEEIFSSGFVTNFPKAAVVVDNNGIIRNTSLEFCKLIQRESKDFIGINYSNIFPEELSEKVQAFIDSSYENEESDLQIKSFNSGYPGGVHIFVNRIYDSKNRPAGLTLVLEEIRSSDNLEFIINSRGRMFDILIKNNPEPIFIYDTDNLRFLEVNDSALSLYGYRRDEFLQMDLTDLYTPEDIQTLLDSSNSKTIEGHFNGPFRHKKKDGTSVFVEISKITFKFNESDAHFNVIRDITEILELEKKSQLFKAAFDSTDDLLFLTDPEGFITFINKPITSILGYHKNDLDNVSFATLVRNEERATVNTSIFQSHFREIVSLTMELKDSSGEFLQVELTATPVLDYKSEIDSFIIVGKYSKEPEVKEVVNEVVKEVVKEVIVEKTVNVPAADAGDNSAFLSGLFHEILTPINVILGFVQELSESIENITPEQKESIDIIGQNRINLLNIMNSIAEFSSIQKNTVKINPEEIGITEVIDEIQNDLNEISAARGIDFAYGKISSSLKFESDRLRFKQLSSLLLKIVTNVTREKKIYFSSYQIDEDLFALSIKDSYSSASKLLIDNLSILFAKEEKEITKDFGISKLSLRLAKALLKLLGGRFEVLKHDSEKRDYAFVFPIKFDNIPAEFITVEEPLQPSAKEPVEEIRQDAEKNRAEDETIIEELVEEPVVEVENVVEATAISINKPSDKLDISQLNCLYIEDQIDSQILFKVQMKELKDIKFAVSFEDAIPLLDNNHFDFIVMDINLQGEYNGLDALKIVHKMPGFESIPVIAVTAYVLPGDKEKFIASGFNDFISKPIFREKMIDSLEKIFLMQT